MSSVLMNLTADAGERRSANAVFAVIIVNSQGTVPCLVVELFYSITADAPDRVLPTVLVVVADILKILLKLVDLGEVFDSLQGAVPWKASSERNEFSPPE